MTKRIWRVYYGLPDLVNPTEVTRMFSKMAKRDELRKEPDKHGLEILEIERDLRMLMALICPKHCRSELEYLRNEHGKKFCTFVIYEPVTASLHTTGQDDD